MINIEKLTLEEWLKELKPYQKNTIIQLVDKYGEERAAEEWLSSVGPIETAQFGGVASDQNQIKSYWSRVKKEFDKLICGHSDYTNEREKLISGGKVIGTGAVTTISVWIAPIVGLSVPILVPAIILLLHTVAKISVKAYCSINEETEEIKDNDELQ